jgi:predicted enzyme related to lactoylglutathione lyase
MQPKFEGGVNVALKIPLAKYDQTIAFYRDILQLDVKEVKMDHPTVLRTHQVTFGPMVLWLDCVPSSTHSEAWLEINCKDVPASAKYFRSHETVFCDEIESLPDGMHWIMDPAGTVFILRNKE